MPNPTEEVVMDPFTAGFYDGCKHAVKSAMQLAETATHNRVAIAFTIVAKALAQEIGVDYEALRAEAKANL